MTLNGGACILNYSRAVLTNCPMDFGLLVPSLLQGGTRKRKTKRTCVKIKKNESKQDSDYTTTA